MAEIQLIAETGREAGSRSSKRLRREGKIPGVVYGHGADPVSVAVDARELRYALNYGEVRFEVLQQFVEDANKEW